MYLETRTHILKDVFSKDFYLNDPGFYVQKISNPVKNT